jgi:hypothetical protein
VLVGILAVLVFAATAAAEIRTGEATTPLNEGPLTAEATIVSGAASYDTSGIVSLTLTTAEPPQANDTRIEADVLEAQPCALAELHAALTHPPAAAIESRYESPEAMGVLVPSGHEVVPIVAAKAVSGSTTTISFSSPAAANLRFNCAFVATDVNGEADSVLVIPLRAPPAPPAPILPVAGGAPQAPTPPAPASPQAKLAIAKLKPLTLKPGKWRTVKVTVTNEGGAASTQGTLRVKQPAGVLVKPEKQQLPALAPGASTSVSVRVEITAKAKGILTLQLTGTASGITATSSLRIKSKS